MLRTGTILFYFIFYGQKDRQREREIDRRNVPIILFKTGWVYPATRFKVESWKFNRNFVKVPDSESNAIPELLFWKILYFSTAIFVLRVLVSLETEPKNF